MVAAGCALLVAAGAVLAPHVSAAPVLAFALAFAAVSGEILALALAAPVLTPAVALGAVLLALIGLVCVGGAAPSAGAAALLTLSLGAGAALVGGQLGGRIEKPGQLAAVALVSALADTWSVFDVGAPSAQAAREALAHPEVLHPFALPFPLLGTDLIPALIGGGDVLFAALYLAAFRRHGLSPARATLALAVGFALGLVALLVSERPLPLLPLLGGAVVASEPRARSLSVREWRTVLAVCAALALGLAVRLTR